jgi:hypothetical protein
MRRAFLLLLVTAIGAAAASDAEAQKRRQRFEPHIEYVFPAGARRGATVEVTLGGVNLQGAHTVRVNGAGVAGAINKVLNPKTVKATLTVAPDAALGEREIRLLTPIGFSSRFRFIVGQLPEVNEVEPNSEKAQAQRLESLPVVVNGQILPGDRDYFRFRARARETLVARVEARQLLPFLADAVPGWNDPCLTLYDANGRELASVDDYHLKPDPVLFFKVPRDGEYLVEVRDIIYRGRADFVYRLTLGVLPYVTEVYPLGARRGTTPRVQLFGVNLPQSALSVPLPAHSPAVRTLEVTAGGIVSNAVPFAVGDAPELEEKEPNNTLAQANRVSVPITVNGRIHKGDDEDHFVFAAKAGERLLLEVQARRLDSPLDSILTLFGPKQQEVAENDDAVDLGEGLLTHHADSHLVYTVPVTGDYTARIRDVQGKGGPEYAYRLVIAPVRPDFYLYLSPDNPAVGQGDTTVITLTAVRKDGFNGEIALTARDLPPGFAASRPVIPPGQNLAYLTLTAPSDAAMQVLSPTILGTATVGKDTTTRQALPAEEMMQAFSYRHIVPTQELLLSVREAPPFTMSVKLPPGGVLTIPQGGEAQVVARVTRKKVPPPLPAPPPPEPRARGKAAPPLKDQPPEQVVVTAGGIPPPPGITVTPAFIPPEGDEVAVTIKAAKSARPDIPRSLVLVGTTRVGRGKQSRLTPAIPVRVVAAPVSGDKKR